MYKKIIIIIISIATILFLLLYQSNADAVLEFEEGNIDVFFCPKDNCEKILFNLINSSENVECALFDLDLESIVNILKEKNAKLIIDHRNYDGLNISAKVINRSGLMHNKFCVFDKKRVFTGSFNPTERGAHKNNNNMIIITSNSVANEYSSYFFYLYNDSEIIDEENIIVNGSIVKIYECPMDHCLDKLSKELQKARKSIYFMIFSFTAKDIAIDLVIKNLEGLKISGVVEKTQISKYSAYHFLRKNDVDIIKDKNKYNLHHKVFIIDNKTVITGSFNPSKNANTRNDENIIIIENKEIAEQFIEEYTELYPSYTRKT